MKPKHHYKTSLTVSEKNTMNVQSAPNFILQDLNLQQKLFEKNESRK
jgi:hypothetical protein